MIKAVKFKEPVQIGGPIADMTRWDRDKHSAKYPLEERGNFLLITVGEERRRVPMSNVAYISEVTSEEKKGGKG